MGVFRKLRGKQKNKVHVNQNSGGMQKNKTPNQKKQNRKRTKYNTQKEMLLVHEFENENVFIEVGRIILRFFT